MASHIIYLSMFICLLICVICLCKYADICINFLLILYTRLWMIASNGVMRELKAIWHKNAYILCSIAVAYNSRKIDGGTATQAQHYSFADVF